MFKIFKRNFPVVLLTILGVLALDGYGAYGSKLTGNQRYIAGFTPIIFAIYIFWILNKEYILTANSIKITKTIVHSWYFWVGLWFLYVTMFLLTHSDLSLTDRLYGAVASVWLMYYVRAFLLGKEISIGVAHIDPNGNILQKFSRLFFFTCCFLSLLILLVI